MTLWGRLFRRTPDVETTTELWPTPDGDDLTVMVTPPLPGAPILLLLHGLEGSIHSQYAAAILREAHRRGWIGVLLHFRTCDGRMNRVRRTYHSGETEDVDLVVRNLLTRFPRQHLALVGVSLGANVILKWLGEQRDDIDRRVVAAVAVSTPFDLDRSSTRINEGFSRLYQWHFVRKLRRKALMKLEYFPYAADRERVLKARTFREFDDAFTAPLHGFSGAADYYRRSSSLPSLARIRIPTLLLSARDDPFHPRGVLDDVAAAAGGNPCLHLEFTQRGGHVGFVEGPPWNPRYYLDRRVLDFLGPYA